ncbi:MAG TPA: fibronectin type III domain-containing protein [Verrucomicrobiae bacterium]|nr:fibronectin type III domain-containing protein [Verrucomicrobiae bacterium]
MNFPGLCLALAVSVLGTTSLYGIPLTSGEFSTNDSVITFETGSTGLPSISGVSFSGGDATFGTYGFGDQYFGNLNGATYLDVYFAQPQQAVGAYMVDDEYFGGVTGVIEVVYDQSNNVIETVSANFPPWGSTPGFLGLGEPTAQIYRAEWQYIGSGYFGVDNVTYGTAIGLSQMPNIPTGLHAELNAGQVMLNWSPSFQATSYNVERGNTAGGPYTIVGNDVDSTNYIDTTVTNGSTYFYVVTGVNDYGESGVSHQVVAFIVDHFAFAPVGSPQTASVPFTVSITACDSNGLVLSNFSGAGTLSAAGDYGIDPLTPAGTSAFVNGQWTGAVTVTSAYADTNVRLNCASNGVAGTSNPFDVVAPPIQLFTLTAADLVYNPFRKLLYATMLASAGSYSNCLVTIDPVLGRVVNSYYLGNDPSSLALSADGQFLYIGFSGTNMFEQFNLATNGVDFQVSLGVDSYSGYPIMVDQLASLPGQPHSVAVAASAPYGGTAEVLMFDDAVQRPNFYASGASVVAGSANELFAMGGGYPSSPFAVLAADASGITNFTYEDGIVGVNEGYKYQGGLIFTSGGTVFSPDTTNVLGHLTNCDIVEPNLAAGIIFSMGSEPVWGQPDAWTIYAWNPTNLQMFASLPVPGVLNGPTRLIRWGTNGLAFCAANQLFLVRTSLIPVVPPVVAGGSCQASGSFQLSFTGDPTITYAVSASTDLANWAQLGPPNLVSNGWFRYLDQAATNYPHRFYRTGVAP